MVSFEHCCVWGEQGGEEEIFSQQSCEAEGGQAPMTKLLWGWTACRTVISLPCNCLIWLLVRLCWVRAYERRGLIRIIISNFKHVWAHKKVRVGIWACCNVRHSYPAAFPSFLYSFFPEQFPHSPTDDTTTLLMIRLKEKERNIWSFELIKVSVWT